MSLVEYRDREKETIKEYLRKMNLRQTETITIIKNYTFLFIKIKQFDFFLGGKLCITKLLENMPCIMLRRAAPLAYLDGAMWRRFL